MVRGLNIYRCALIFLSFCMAALISAHPAHAGGQSRDAVIQRLPSLEYFRQQAIEKLSAAERSRSPGLRDISTAFEKTTQKPFSPAATIESTEVQASKFIAQHASELGLQANAADSKITVVTRTLSGQHIDVEQRFNGLPILNSHITINVSEDGFLQSVTRNVVNIPLQKANTIAARPAFDNAKALSIAWDDLKVAGSLMEAPTAKLVYLNENTALTLVYLVRIAVTQPFGYWEYAIDAQTGRIVSTRDRAINERKRGLPVSDVELAPNESRMTSLGEAIAALSKASLPKAVAIQATDAEVTAPALIFVPNPVTRLRNESLRDASPASLFEHAYQKVDLRHLRRNGSMITLLGTNARIEDIEPGEGGASRAPSSATSEWTDRRGSNGFNDVMSYYYIDTSIDYLRRIGYVGTKELFPHGISVDSDGLRGMDDSHYISESDFISFGHGGIDDNEDSDVILHELGHAISLHANSRWLGGDSGAIGEGFGDYWAASQRIRMKDGWLLKPGHLFLWDGNGETWNGRRDDRRGISYDPLRNYKAHEWISADGGYFSDELWSTPLSLSLIELLANGESHESVDIVVIEGMANIGDGFTMRSLALKTIEAARTMFPPPHRHAEILEKQFRNVKIIQ